MVSIIVPIYQAEAFLEETLESIAQTRYAPLEVILMDDGSRDGSMAIAQRWAEKDERFNAYHQENGGVSVARNHAIRLSHGTYILPVDADNKIDPTYVEKAVKVLEARPEVKGVGCRAMFFGEKEGEWVVPRYTPKLLARKNMIDACAMYRREDYDRTDGYMEGLQVREDWDFWLSMLEDGGEFVRLDEVLLYYRVRGGSKRVRDREKKEELIRVINQRHKAFIYQQLGGPLHYHRSWSRWINLFYRERQVGEFEDWQQGDVIFKRRNTLRRYEGKVIKEFAVPSLIKGLIYGTIRKSKARRSYEYAKRLGDMTPAPIAYKEIKWGPILRESWYCSEAIDGAGTFNDLVGHKDYPHREEILSSIGRFTARLHTLGVVHEDYSGGNILFNEDGSRVWVVDLNRMRFGHVSREKGLLNFERLNIDRNALRTMAGAYAQAMGYDEGETAEFIIHHRWKKHIQQGITNL